MVMWCQQEADSCVGFGFAFGTLKTWIWINVDCPVALLFSSSLPVFSHFPLPSFFLLPHVWWLWPHSCIEVTNERSVCVQQVEKCASNPSCVSERWFWHLMRWTWNWPERSAQPDRRYKLTFDSFCRTVHERVFCSKILRDHVNPRMQSWISKWVQTFL